MTRLSPVQNADQVKGLRSRSLASKLAVFATAAALTIAPALIGGTAANAAEPLVITTPAQGATNVPSGALPFLVDFAGTDMPVGDYPNVTYTDLAGDVKQGSFAGGTTPGDGSWTQQVNFNQLTPGQTLVTATVRGFNIATNLEDPEVIPTTVTFTLAAAPVEVSPLAVTRPVSNSDVPVEDTTPIFSGTGTPGFTIEITYGARALATGVAATDVLVGLDGTWTTETDFSDLEPGVTEGRGVVTQYSPDGTAAPGTNGLAINFVFPAAPAPLIPLALTIEPETLALSAATSTGVGFLAEGFSPNEELTIVVTDSNGGEVVFGATEESFFADDADGSFLGFAILPSTAGTGTYTITVDGVRSGRTVAADFTVVADAVAPGAPGAPGSLPVVSG